ncbi:unnamed protein product [Soboliphyme baturini]|uniref:5'-AMP-activated protein kinase subunit gamma-1-like n=1 Tax=Soboliphyme baturini TaxID=241478 RepID=A0A183IH03_9BILA|nr:unnamed protein product [Soboliphyme baturini]
MLYVPPGIRRGDPDVAYAQFLKMHKCYDVMPKNSKLVVLNTALPVKKALYALIYSGVRSAMLYDDSDRSLCGHLTISDFINILLKYYDRSPEELSTLLSNQVISQWREILKSEDRLKVFRKVGANQSLYDAFIVLLETSYHRIPVLDETSGNPLHFLTHKRLLQYLYLYMNDLPKPSYLYEGVRFLNIGTYESVLYVHPNTKLIDCLARLSEKPISAVPVVESDGTVVDVYARFDAIQIAAEGSFTVLSRTVREALQSRKNAKWFSGVVTCVESDTLLFVIEKLVVAEVHSLIVLNDENHLSGIITVSDVLRYIIMKPQRGIMKQ